MAVASFSAKVKPMNGCSPEKGVAVDHRLFLLQKRPVNDFAKKRRKLNGTTPAIRSAVQVSAAGVQRA